MNSDGHAGSGHADPSPRARGHRGPALGHQLPGDPCDGGAVATAVRGGAEVDAHSGADGAVRPASGRAPALADRVRDGFRRRAVRVPLHRDGARHAHRSRVTGAAVVRSVHGDAGRRAAQGTTDPGARARRRSRRVRAGDRRLAAPRLGHLVAVPADRVRRPRVGVRQPGKPLRAATEAPASDPVDVSGPAAAAVGAGPVARRTAPNRGRGGRLRAGPRRLGGDGVHLRARHGRGQRHLDVVDGASPRGCRRAVLDAGAGRRDDHGLAGPRRAPVDGGDARVPRRGGRRGRHVAAATWRSDRRCRGASGSGECVSPGRGCGHAGWRCAARPPGPSPVRGRCRWPRSHRRRSGRPTG